VPNGESRVEKEVKGSKQLFTPREKTRSGINWEKKEDPGKIGEGSKHGESKKLSILGE